MQGQGNGYGSPPIYATYMSGLTIENVNTLSTGIDTCAVNAGSSSNGLLISGCVFRSTSDKVTNRKSMVGALVGVATIYGPVTVTDNQLYGSPQIGIFAAGSSSDADEPQTDLTISNNVIESNGIVGDGYGILVHNVDQFTFSGNTTWPGRMPASPHGRHQTNTSRGRRSQAPRQQMAVGIWSRA